MAIQKKVILITGATSGLGKTLAEYLTAKGNKVYGTSRKLEGDQNGVEIIKMDVTDRDAVEEGIKNLLKVEDTIDVLINNAGLGIAAPTEEIDQEELNKVFQTNIYGVLNTVAAVLPQMRKQRSGYIINISSIGSEIGLPFRGLYCASKAAVDKITEGLRLEMRNFGIKVTSIQAGDIKTNINENRLKPAQVSDVYRKEFEKTYQVIDSDVLKGVDPIIFGPIVEKIIHSKNPKRYYRVGKTLQRWAPTLKNLLPTSFFENMLMKDYE